MDRGEEDGVNAAPPVPAPGAGIEPRAGGELALFLVLTLGATAMLHGALIALGAAFSLSPARYPLYVYLAGLAGPSLAAIALTRDRGAFLRDCLDLRGIGPWVGAALAAQPAILALAWGMSWTAGERLPVALRPSEGFALLALGQVWVVFGEEFGWRGYALPRLRALVGPRAAALGLAAAWGLWHAPMFFVAGSLQWGVSPWLFAASIFAWSAIHAALYWRAQPSLWPNLAFHASANITLGLGVIGGAAEPFLVAAYVLFGLAALAAGAGHGRRGPRETGFR